MAKTFFSRNGQTDINSMWKFTMKNVVSDRISYLNM